MLAKMGKGTPIIRGRRKVNGKMWRSKKVKMRASPAFFRLSRCSQDDLMQNMGVDFKKCAIIPVNLAVADSYLPFGVLKRRWTDIIPRVYLIEGSRQLPTLRGIETIVSVSAFMAESRLVADSYLPFGVLKLVERGYSGR